MSDLLNDERPGPNAHLEVEWIWTFRLGKRDALLVLKALGGRLENNAEREAASELCDRLTVLREATARDQFRALEWAANKAKEKLTPKEGEK